MQLYQSYLLGHSPRLYFSGSSRERKQKTVLSFESLDFYGFFFKSLGIVLGCERKSCCNTGQVCHFLSVPHILRHKWSNNQELVLMLAWLISKPVLKTDGLSQCDKHGVGSSTTRCNHLKMQKLQ